MTKTTLNVLVKPGYAIVRLTGCDWQNGSAEISFGAGGLVGNGRADITVLVRAEDASATHTVAFDSGHGVTEVSVPAGESLGENMPADPVYYNQKVNGWNTRTDGKGFDITADTPITQDLTVYPQCSTTSLLSEYHIMGLERIQEYTAFQLGVDAADVSIQQVQATDGKNTTTALRGSNYYNSGVDCWTALNAGSIVKPENLTGLVVTAKVDGQTKQVAIPASDFASVTRYQYFAEIYVDGAPTVAIDAADNAAVTLALTDAGAVSYSKLKEDIAACLSLTLDGEPLELAWDALTYACEVKGQFVPLEEAGAALASGEPVQVKVSIPDGEGYRGNSVAFQLTVAAPPLSVKSDIWTVTLKETAVGDSDSGFVYGFDYENLARDIFNAAIDTDLAFEEVEVSVPADITKSGSYPVTVTDSASGYAVTFNVEVEVELLPTAEIAVWAPYATIKAIVDESGNLNEDDFDGVLEAILETDSLIDWTQCKANGLDTELITYEILEEITTPGDYTMRISYPDTETMHGSYTDITLNVTQTQ